MDIKILLAEDEDNIRKLVASYLINEGFKVIQAADGEQAMQLFDEHEPIELAILDVMMPKADGFEVCKYIRDNSQTPVLMLTARDTEQDELFGFKCGADEYISKPFSPAILVTRVKNLLRRFQLNSMDDLHGGGIVIEYRERQVKVDGAPVILTPKEFDLLYYLMSNKNIVLTRDQILTKVWDIDYEGDDRTIDTHIKCLRAKLGRVGSAIMTVRKVGYKFEEKNQP